MTLLIIAFAVSVVVNVWMVVTRTVARRTAIELDEQCYLAGRAAVHAINGTVSGDPAVVDELAELRFSAACEDLAAGRFFDDLTDVEQNEIRRAARRRLVLEGHMTVDRAHRGNLLDLDEAIANAKALNPAGGRDTCPACVEALTKELES